MLLRLAGLLPLLAAVPALGQGVGQPGRYRGDPALPVIADDAYHAIGNGSSVRCGVDPAKEERKGTAVQDCWDDYGRRLDGRWAGAECGGKSFYISQRAYPDPADHCYRICKPCIDHAIAAGHRGGRCVHLAANDTEGGLLGPKREPKTCWTGFIS
ncbi:MAG: hypothetical protein M1832_004618 [Thelocarpon impressellum]|nr:MAG: hypothetical protein M1832_004618 [Thelocarpon impressellum]